MMKRILYATIGLAALSGLSGCVDHNSMNEADFVSQTTDISLTVNGKEQMTYDSRIHQLAYSERDCQFRVMDDELNNYFVVTLDRMPSKEGEHIKGKLIYTTDDDIPETDTEFSVAKLTDDKIWLWDNSGKIGVVVMIIR